MPDKVIILQTYPDGLSDSEDMIGQNDCHAEQKT